MKQLFIFLLYLLGIKIKHDTYYIEYKLRKLAVKIYGKNVLKHDKIAYLGTYIEDTRYLVAINTMFNCKLTSIYNHAPTTTTYRNYNSLATEIYIQINPN
jgi:hypothetical protein